MTRKNRFFYRLIRFFFRIASVIAMPVRAEGLERLPEGAAIFCANHTTAVDPALLALALERRRYIRFVAKAQARDIPVFGRMLEAAGVIFVRRDGKDYDSIRACLRVLSDGEQLMIFPEGTRVKPGQTVKPQNGAVHLASRKGVPLVPVYIPREKRIFRPVSVRFGEAYTLSKTPEEGLDALSAELMERIAALEERDGEHT